MIKSNDPLGGARRALAAGQVAQALDIVEARIRAAPQDAAALHLKGLILFRRGSMSAGEAALQSAARQAPQNATVLGDLGRIQAAQGAFSDAAASFRRAIAIDPRALAEREDLGTALCCLEQFDEGAREYEAVLRQAPGRAVTMLRLARVRVRQNQAEEARRLAREAMRIEPRLAGKAIFMMGQAAMIEERHEEAERDFTRAIEAGEDSAELLLWRARARHRQDKLELAFADAQAAAKRPGGSGEAELLAARIAAKRGDISTAAALGKAAVASRPTSFRTRWIAANLLAPVLDHESDVAIERRHWREAIGAAAADLRLDNPERINEAVTAVQEVTNFHLHYRGVENRSEQELYGGVLTRVAAARWPDLAERPRRTGRPRAGGRRPRVGFLSAFLNEHTIWKIWSGWITDSSAAIEKYVYYPARREDPGFTDMVRAAADHWRQETDIARLAATIAADQLDVLIYLDHGMVLELQLLAALPLAPVQANALGHPITSGMASFTHALSSARMEPADGERHYSEALVRLSGSGSRYGWAKLARQIENAPPPPAERDASRVRFLCAQNLSKYLPQHDGLLASIAAALPAAEFHFLGENTGRVERLQGRLARAFAALGLDAENHLRFHGYLKPAGFFRLNLDCDVFLDTVLWSGNNTAHEATACGLPIVTWPGPEMRGRHSFALLSMMGMEETIAGSADEYVDLAVALGRNPEHRRHLRQEIERRRPAIYDDPAPIADLERFIFEQVEGRD
ncbi:MAG TPA: tetratricopeptide repeat protein [Hypericibacter adhaerens]|uniref:O-linked N-acetylglucosamine transferase family protein n=1 Tax=Hypericibacter adhaerens TaxID=2602016 RepID=UPI002C662C01|nr:tetratricopeptide repeat protein [Hypericibacter adhaerens]HWA44516.1 tetratricopeptide repeat protein [Hypericibacter adhaerens]